VAYIFINIVVGYLADSLDMDEAGPLLQKRLVEEAKARETPTDLSDSINDSRLDA